MFYLTNFTRNEISEAAPPVSCPAYIGNIVGLNWITKKLRSVLLSLNYPDRSRPFELNVLKSLR